MTFQSKIGTSLPPEREPVRVSLALLSSPAGLRGLDLLYLVRARLLNGNVPAAGH